MQLFLKCSSTNIIMISLSTALIISYKFYEKCLVTFSLLHITKHMLAKEYYSYHSYQNKAA